MLTDSYKKIEEGYITLSGKSTGVTGVAYDIISSLAGGESEVVFKPTDDFAIKLVEEKLGKKYVANEEGFIIHVDTNVTIYADTNRAKLYAACSLKDKYQGRVSRGIWWSYPECSHRSIRIFIPPKAEKEYFFTLVDQMVHLGYNSMLLEICGAMEFKKHPEINQAWLTYCSSVRENLEKYNHMHQTYYRPKNSIHTCNAGGDVYSQEEMKELVDYCRERFIDIVPEVPSLSHSEYLLVPHPELRECDDEDFASTACPQNPGLNELVFDLYDDVIDVFKPKALHIGHDEWWVMCVCDKCKDKDPSELYANNVLESYNYLKAKGIKTYMWADKLHKIVDKRGEAHGASEKLVYAIPTEGNVKTLEVMGKTYPLYDIHWFEAPDYVKEKGFCHKIHEINCSHLLPSDIMYVDWYYSVDPHIGGSVFHREGKDMILGNAEPSGITNYKERFKYGAQGFSVSSWAETDEIHTQSWGTVYQMGYGAVIAWNHDRNELSYKENVFDAMNGLFNLRNREVLEAPHLEVTHTVTKEWKEGRKYYTSMENIDKDFLTLGEYLVTYKDGTEEKFPVMFAVNITHRDVSLDRCESSVSWCYRTDPDFPRVASKCTMTEAEDGVWYTTVMPLSGEVENCVYIPKKGFEDYVAVKSIEVK